MVDPRPGPDLEGDGDDAMRMRAPRPAGDRPGVSLRGIQLVVRTLADAPLHHTARRFPHVINKLADAWETTRDFDAVIDELLFTDRPARRGFPPEVLRELSDLRCLRERRIVSAGTSGAGDADPAADAADTWRRLMPRLGPSGR
jgi:hypothetical protein